MTQTTVAPDDPGAAVVTETPRSKLGEPLGRVSANGVGKLRELDSQRRNSRDTLASGSGRRYEYDAEMRLQRVTERDGVTARTVLEFDDRRNPKRVSLPGGGSVDAQYDKVSRLRSQTHRFGGYVDAATFSYDAMGRARTATFDGGLLQLGYDILGYPSDTVLTYDGASYGWHVTPYRNGATRVLQ